jgi:hypothetical protein
MRWEFCDKELCTCTRLHYLVTMRDDKNLENKLTHFHFAKLPPLHIHILYYLPETHANIFKNRHKYINPIHEAYLRKHELVFHNRFSIFSALPCCDTTKEAKRSKKKY